MEVGTELVSRSQRMLIGRRAFHAIARFDSLSPNASHGMLSAAVEPSLTVFVQGKKRISLGGIAYSAVLRHSSYPR